MALLQNEDFLIWQLRASYLNNIKDGIGERLINIDNSILNDPNFRAAGWLASAIDAKRTHSPDIPTGVASDYFAAPPRSAGMGSAALNDDEDEGGMVTGRGSTDTVGPTPNVRRRRRREQQDEDDSSDLSDDSEDELETSRRAAQQIKFAKMPIRSRSGSSPIRSSYSKDGVEVNIISPSRRSHEGRLRSGSLTGVEAIKQRARRDTTTSSEFSSENEVDQGTFKRRHLIPNKAAKSGDLLTQKHEEDQRQQQMRSRTNTIEEGSEGGDRSDLSSEFGGSADSESLLDDIEVGSLDMPPPLNLGRSDSPSPKRQKPATPYTLQALPPPRPISTIAPVSLLGQALNARKAKPKNPVEPFAKLSGKGVPDPLHIRIFATFSESRKPLDMPLLRNVQANDSGENPQTTVADAIGLALWQYGAEDIKPTIEAERLNVNRWTLRMIEDGEVDYDFPPLVRTQPITKFTSNNNRGVRGRSRETPYDEFALVEASEAQCLENKRLTPKYEESDSASSAISPEPEVERTTATQSPPEKRPVASPTISSRKLATIPADRPNFNIVHSTPRVGPPKQIKIYFTSLEAFSQSMMVEVSTDTYLAEVLDQACKHWNVDRAYHILKVHGTATIAPVDRTVEALGTRSELDLARRRFANDGAIGIAGSPGSSSPNAPLLFGSDSPKRGVAGKRAQGPMAHQPQHGKAYDPFNRLMTTSSNPSKYQRWIVTRKQTMSFSSSQQRVLLLDEEFFHILPVETAHKGMLLDASASSKEARRIPHSMIIGCKVSRRHPKSLRVVVAREGGQEQKRYDFDAATSDEANEIVEEIRKCMEMYGGRDVE